MLRNDAFAVIQALFQSELPLPNRRQGKVRDVYDATLEDGGRALLIVASDRISAFDVVMPTPIPGKGALLTALSRFWFDLIQKKLGGRFEHHLLATDAQRVVGLTAEQKQSLRGRVMVGRKCEVVPIECVVRGYLAGSGWKEYQQTQSVCGVKLPPGLRQCEKLPEPIFTPATKEASGHDVNISFEEGCQRVGTSVMTTLRDWSLAIYQLGHDHAATRGIILADTKFEFGFPEQESSRTTQRPSDTSLPILIDEVMTPDSSRFWPMDRYAPGRDQESYDKQYLRNWLEGLVAAGTWAKSPPGPTLPPDVVEHTQRKYEQAYRLITGQTLA